MIRFGSFEFENECVMADWHWRVTEHTHHSNAKEKRRNFSKFLLVEIEYKLYVSFTSAAETNALLIDDDTRFAQFLCH